MPNGPAHRSVQSLRRWASVVVPRLFSRLLPRRSGPSSPAIERAEEQRIAAAQEYVLQALRDSTCADCGQRDPIVLEFDHVGEKQCEIATLVRRGVTLARLAAEMSRCEVVCANCHRRRTAMRAGWRRLDPDAHPHEWRSVAHRRNVLYAYGVLTRSGCVDCGITDLCVLDFDHIGPKRLGVMRLARNEVGLARLRSEIRECEVRCANCHRRRTAATGRHRRAMRAG
jgi:hypothetical protein